MANTNGKYTADELRAVLGAREATRIAKLVEAARAPEVREDQLEALVLWLEDPSQLGQSQTKVVPALRAYYETHSHAKNAVRAWLAEMGVAV